MNQKKILILNKNYQRYIVSLKTSCFHRYNIPNGNQPKKRTWKILDFAVPAEHRVKLKGSEKRINASTLQGN